MALSASERHTLHLTGSIILQTESFFFPTLTVVQSIEGIITKKKNKQNTHTKKQNKSYRTLVQPLQANSGIKLNIY